MSEVAQLLRELCPQGVEYAPLGTIAGYAEGRVDASELSLATFTGVDNLVANRGGRVDASFSANTARVTLYLPADTLLGNIRPYLKKVWLADHRGGCSGDVLCIRRTPAYEARMMPEFLHLVLSSDRFFEHNVRYAKGAKMPRGDKDSILRFPVPLPPLAVQQRVVDTLSDLDRLTKGVQGLLAAEVEARRKQRDHYKGQVLAKVQTHPQLPLHSVAHFFNAKAHEKLVDPAGTVALLTARFISTNGKVARYVHPYDVLSPALEGDVALVMSDLPNGRALARTFLVDANDKYAANQRVCLLRVRDRTVAAPRFLFHALNRHPGLLSYNNGSDQTHLKKGYIEDLSVGLPPLSEQLRLVEALDRLDDTFGEMLDVALPAELVARRSQYEHYLDRLLTFSEAATSVGAS